VLLHPIHSLVETDKREFHAWPAERTLGSPALGGVEVPITDPLSFKEIRSFIADELRLVAPTDSVGILNVYQDAMNQVIDKCTTLAPLLVSIRDAYNTRVSEL
jgi:hypothetical protein